MTEHNLSMPPMPGDALYSEGRRIVKDYSRLPAIEYWEMMNWEGYFRYVRRNAEKDWWVQCLKAPKQ